MMKNVLGFIVKGIPIPWIFLQFISIVTCVFTILLAVSWRKVLFGTVGFEKVQLVLKLIGEYCLSFERFIGIYSFQ